MRNLSQPLLELRSVSSGYGSRKVLDDVSIQIQEGDIAVLIGPNGSGKSTVLRTIYGLANLLPSSSGNGQLIFRGEELSGLKPSQRLNRGLIFIPQINKGFYNLTVNENLRISGLALRDPGLLKERFDEVLGHLPMLRELRNRRPLNMSGGEVQFLALGMALLHRPKMILMDEPLAGLSPESVVLVRNIIRKLHSQERITFLIAEHMISEVIELTNHLIALESGQIVRDFAVDETFDKNSLVALLF